MTVGQIMCICMIGTGILLIAAVLVSLAKRKMQEGFCLAWGFFAVLMILAGCLLHPTELDGYISATGVILVLFVAYSFLFSAYLLSEALSKVIRKNHELAMQVSILNAENERITEEIQRIAEKLKVDEE